MPPIKGPSSRLLLALPFAVDFEPANDALVPATVSLTVARDVVDAKVDNDVDVVVIVTPLLSWVGKLICGEVVIVTTVVNSPATLPVAEPVPGVNGFVLVTVVDVSLLVLSVGTCLHIRLAHMHIVGVILIASHSKQFVSCVPSN